jgi:anti-anti-sigma factor
VTVTDSFRCEVEKAKDDEFGNKVTLVKCHGKLVSETASELKAVVKPLIPEGGRIILDVGDVIHVDSSGLGALVALKATAIKQGYCILELDNITPRVLDLLRITNLKQMFMGQAAAN